MAIVDPRVRVAGHSYSLWIWGESAIAYATNVTHTSPQPLAQAVPIQPLNYVRPAEIVTGRAIGPGTITMTVTELYGRKPWEHLGGSFGDQIQDLADVFHKMAREYTEFTNDQAIRFVRVIRPPGGGIYIEKYYGIRITDIREDENVSTDTLNNQLTITIQYTYKRQAAVGATGVPSAASGADPTTIPDPKIYP